MMAPTLESLPVDIHFIIFKYLAPLPLTDTRLSTHPYFALSRTSKPLRASLDSFAGHLLLTSPYQHRSKVQRILTQCSGDYRKTPASPCLLLSTYMKSACSLCIFCGKSSNRRAIMDSGVICCNNCDRKHYGDKITMTDAMKQYHLKKEDLFGGIIPFSLGGPIDPPAVSEDGILFQRPGLKYGQYVSNSVLTTMFLEDDVKSLACRKHGTDDLDGHRRQMREKYQQKQAKAELNKRNRIDYFRRLAIANGLSGDIAERLYKWSNRRKLQPLQLIRNELLLKRVGLKAVDHYWGTNPQPWSEDKPSQCWYYIRDLLPANECDRYCEWEEVDWTKHCYYRYERHLKMRRYDHETDDSQHIYQYKQQSGPGSKLVFHTKSKVPVVYCQGEDGELEDLLTIRKVDIMDPSDDIPWHQRVASQVVEPKFNPTEKKVRIIEWFDPLDKCLFEAFVMEFVMFDGELNEEDVDTSCCALRKNITTHGTYSKIKQPYLPNSYDLPIKAPWSWANYPIYVYDVVTENYEEDENQNIGSSNSETAVAAAEFFNTIEEDDTIIVRGQQQSGGNVKGKRKSKAPAKSQTKAQKRAAAERKVAKRNQETKEVYDNYVEHIRETLVSNGIEHISSNEGRDWDKDVLEPFREVVQVETKKGKKGKGKDKDTGVEKDMSLRQLSQLLGYY